MEKRGMTLELPEVEKTASLSYESDVIYQDYDEDAMDNYIQKATSGLKNKERQTVNKDAITTRTNKLNKLN